MIERRTKIEANKGFIMFLFFFSKYNLLWLLILEKIIQTKTDYIVIDRSPFLIKGKTKLTIQKIPKTIVDCSYPIWLFNETEFKKKFKKKYQEITTFDALDGVLGYGKLKAHYKGIIYKRIKSS